MHSDTAPAGSPRATAVSAVPKPSAITVSASCLRSLGTVFRFLTFSRSHFRTFSRSHFLTFSPSHLLTVFSLAALPAIAAQTPAPTTQPAPVPRAANPHWTKTGCADCHVMSGDQARPIPVQDIEAGCIKCHDGQHALSEPHPVGRRFVSMTPPAGWPAPDDKVTCTTCHKVHPTRDYAAPRPAENPMFLRDYTGDLLAFCGRCHPGANEPQRRYNPHIVQLENGRVVQRSCAFCHTREMPTGAQAVRTGDPALRAPPVNLCIGCHTTHLEWSEKSHIGAKITPAIRARLETFSAGQPPQGGGRLARLPQDGNPARLRQDQPPACVPQPANPPPHVNLSTAYLPLAGGDTVVCSTCHNPHQQGVFPPGSALAAGAIPPGQSTVQLRGLRSDLCGACHGK